MADVELRDVDNHVLTLEKESKVIEAAAIVANAIHAGVGGMIKGSLMERELRDALGLKQGELVKIPRSS